MNLSKTSLNAARFYQDGKDRLDIAIREYDQSVMHLTANVVASTSSLDMTDSSHEVWTRKAAQCRVLAMALTVILAG